MQGLTNELETQGALPRRNSRVSSLATCAPRFVFNALHILYFMVRKTMSCLNIFDLIFSLTVPERASPLV